MAVVYELEIQLSGRSPCLTVWRRNISRAWRFEQISRHTKCGSQCILVNVSWFRHIDWEDLRDLCLPSWQVHPVIMKSLELDQIQKNSRSNVTPSLASPPYQPTTLYRTVP